MRQLQSTSNLPKHLCHQQLQELSPRVLWCFRKGDFRKRGERIIEALPLCIRKSGVVVASIVWFFRYGEGNGTPLQYSCLENPMDGGAWQAAVPGVAKSRTQLSDFTFSFHFHALEKEMATHSSVLAWRIPGTGKPGGLPSMGSHRVGHD